MRIECPECAARYEVPEDRLAPGRPARCARCGREWTPVPAPLIVERAAKSADRVAMDLRPVPNTGPEVGSTGGPVTASDEPLAGPRGRPVHPFLISPRVPSATPSPSLAPSALPARRSTGLAIAWVATVVVIVLAGWVAVGYRGQIARAWPPSLRIYDALNLGVPADR